MMMMMMMMMAKEEEQGVTALPEELVMEILSWVPIEVLLTFRSVSNSWQNLVMNDPAFAKLHHHRAIAAGNQSFVYISKERYALLNYMVSIYQLKPPLQSSQQPSQTKLDGLPIPSKPRLVGSCHGWLCLTYYDDNLIVLVNPCTRVLRMLPVDDQKRVELPGLTLIGFGYDSANDDYKVVRINQLLLNSPECDARVYSTSTQSWRKAEGSVPFSISCRILKLDLGIFVNGALHWRNSEGIISFDLKDEELGKVLPLPPYDDDPMVAGAALTTFLMVIRECLGLLHVCADGVFEVWVMKEYGRSESWSKQFVSILHPQINGITSVSMIGSSQIIFQWGAKGIKEHMALHDMKNGETNLSDYSKVVIESSTTYVESLLTLRTKKRRPPPRGCKTRTIYEPYIIL